MTLKPTRNRAFPYAIALIFTLALVTPCIESQAALASVAGDVRAGERTCPLRAPRLLGANLLLRR